MADPLVELPSLAKSLRNLRDRLASEESWVFERLAFLGIADGEHAHVLVSHPGAGRASVEKRLRRLWPTLRLTDVPPMPLVELDAGMLARLGARGRGTQPLRFQCLPQTC